MMNQVAPPGAASRAKSQRFSMPVPEPQTSRAAAGTTEVDSDLVAAQSAAADALLRCRATHPETGEDVCCVHAAMAAHTNTAAARELRKVADELDDCIRLEAAGCDPQYVAGLQFAIERMYAALEDLTWKGRV